MTRTYTLKRRAEQQAETRLRIVEAAIDLHGSVGPAATTFSMVAERAGVSPETVYKAYGGKAGLVRALHAWALEGDGATPAEERSDRLRSTAPAADVVSGWARLTTEVAPRVAPVILLVRDAAATDPEMRKELAAIEAARHRRNRPRPLARAGGNGASAASDLAAPHNDHQSKRKGRSTAPAPFSRWLVPTK